jgi:hypothetical protein
MTTQRIAATTLLAASLAASLAAGGCRNSSGGAGGGSDAGGKVSATRIPEDARRVSESSGSRLIHRPLREGTIYVQDADTGKLIYSGRVRANSNVVVDPAANAVTVNDQQVKADRKLDPHHTYRLYFRQQM